MKPETEDFKQRRDNFLEGYGKLVQEFRCDFLNSPMFIPSNDENRTWNFTFHTQIMDTSEMAVPSPLQFQ